MPFAILPFLMNNWQMILKVIGVIVIAFAVWWFCIHNPEVIKKQKAELAFKDQQIAARDAAINLIQEIEEEHKKIEDESNENINKIRNGRKPGVRGVFVPTGVLPAVYKPYSSGA